MVSDVPMDKENPFFKSSYASLGAVLKMARPALLKHGLSVVVLPEGNDVGMYVTHKSGQFIKSTMTVSGTFSKKPLQELGSALTYLRRYALCGTLQIVGDEDIDGNDPKSADEQKDVRKKVEQAVKANKPAPFTSQLTAPMVNKLKKIMSAKDMSPDDVIVFAVKEFGGQVKDEGINKKQYATLIEKLEAKEESK